MAPGIEILVPWSTTVVQTFMSQLLDGLLKMFAQTVILTKC